MKKQDRIKKALLLMQENDDKYFDLVWYARADKSKLIDEEKFEIVFYLQKIENKYPVEISELINNNDNWTHGFNSGMLAASRLYLEMIEGDIETALEEFPFLDT